MQLKIILQGLKPAIWRRVLVEDSISFHRLHNIIQMVMGWDNSHLYEFDQGGLSIGMPHEDYGSEVQDAKKIKLNKVLNTKGQRLPYIYDFGDSWEHIILVEKILAKDESQKYPCCIAGKRACPPEDCGGVGGYAEMLEALQDKKHPEHERLKEWIGEFNSEEFDVGEVNKRI